MKKIFLLLISVLLLTGCGKVNKDKLVKEIVDKVEKSDSYLLQGNMSIYNRLLEEGEYYLHKFTIPDNKGIIKKNAIVMQIYLQKLLEIHIGQLVQDL